MNEQHAGAPITTMAQVAAMEMLRKASSQEQFAQATTLIVKTFMDLSASFERKAQYAGLSSQFDAMLDERDDAMERLGEALLENKEMHDAIKGLLVFCGSKHLMHKEAVAAVERAEAVVAQKVVTP